MKVILSVSAGKKPTVPADKVNAAAVKEMRAKFTPIIEKFLGDIRARLEKLGKVSGKAARVDYIPRVKQVCCEDSKYTVWVDRVATEVHVSIGLPETARSIKESKLSVKVVCFRKGYSKYVTRKEFLTAVDIVSAVKEHLEKIVAKKDSPNARKNAEERWKKEFAEKVKKARSDADTINDILPGDHVAVRKSQHLGMRTAYVEVLGTSDKVRGMTIHLNEDGTKFSVGVCPKGFLGGDEYWSDKRFQNKALTQANLEAALKKNGFSLD